MLSTASFWQLLRRLRCQVVLALALPLVYTGGMERGICFISNNWSSLSSCLGLPGEDTQLRFTALTQHGKQQSTGYKLQCLIGIAQGPMDSYRPPQAGQPPASKVLPHHSPLAPLGA